MNINNELKIMIKGRERKIFLQGGFYQNKTICDYLHIHNYAEIHLVAKGKITFVVGAERITIGNGAALVIPGNMYHGYLSKTDDAIHTAFQIDITAKKPSTYAVDENLVCYLFAEIEKTDPQGDHTALAAAIALLCAKLFPHAPLFVHNATDTGYLINDFFNRNYKKEIRLSDLAQLLHLSERQTERLVEEQTGRNFRDQLTATRIRMAEQLLATTDMSRTRVAQYVGYHSYAGFWKAYTKYKQG